MNEILSVVIASTVAGVISLVGNYFFKRSITDRDDDLRELIKSKDEEIAQLETRMRNVEGERLGSIQNDIEHGNKSRKEIYRRMDAQDVHLAEMRRDLKHALDQLPKIDDVTNRLTSVAAVVERVTEQLGVMEARMFSEVEKRAHLAGSVKS